MWKQIKDQFNVAGELKEQDGLLCWTCHENGLCCGSVYVMVLEPGIGDAAETVLYVGMAGKGWKARAGQHNAGLKRVHRGIETGDEWRRHYQERSAWLAEGRRVIVYERAAGFIEAFGEKESVQHAEERILTRKLSPLYNRA